MNSFKNKLLTFSLILAIFIENGESDSNTVDKKICHPNFILDNFIEPKICQLKDHVEDTLPRVKISNVKVAQVAKVTKVGKVTKVAKVTNVATKDVKLSHMQKLLRWINRMKIIWTDFPVSKSEKIQSETAKSWFSCCKDDKVILGKG